MSTYVEQERHFILFLVSCINSQGKLILSNVTDVQIKTLSEIAYNLLELPLSKSEKAFIDKKRTLLNKLSRKKLSTSEKRELIAAKRASILKIIKKFKKILLQVT